MKATLLIPTILSKPDESAGAFHGWMRSTAIAALSFLLVVTALISRPAVAGIFVDPTSEGDTPSGLRWSAVATGTALPVRTAATNAFNGAPGAVMYFNSWTGVIQIDPKGLDLTSLIVTYTTGSTNVSGTTPGPFFYLYGGGTNEISPITGTPRTFPAVTAVGGASVATIPARFGMTIGAPLGATLATVGDVGNIASTNGFWNQPWAFPTYLCLGSSGLMTIDNFRTFGQAANLNANVLGFGSQQAVFQYSANGIIGNQLGAVIPVPEPSAIVLVGVGMGVIGLMATRRKRAA